LCSEPCGLSQMYSLAYGAIPVVRYTGGLANSVRDATARNLTDGKATGVVFREPAVEDFVHAVRRALEIYQDPERRRRLRKAGMAEDFSWERSSREYERLYREALAKP